MKDSNDDRPVTKAEFVWLMVQVAEIDREKYRELRARGWSHARARRHMGGKSEFPN